MMILIQVAVLCLIVVAALLIGLHYHKHDKKRTDDEKKFSFVAFVIGLFLIVAVFVLPIIAEHVPFTQPASTSHTTSYDHHLETYPDEDKSQDINIDVETDQTHTPRPNILRHLRNWINERIPRESTVFWWVFVVVFGLLTVFFVCWTFLLLLIVTCEIIGLNLHGVMFEGAFALLSLVPTLLSSFVFYSLLSQLW